MVALIVTMANEKGGVGKTTTAVELALQGQRNGLKTVIVDADHQQSSAKFKLRREQLSPELPRLRVLPIVGKTVGVQIRDVAAEHDLVVVDAGGRDSAEMRLAMLTSHVVVVPTSAKAAETDGFNKMAQLVNEIRLQNTALKAAWLMTRLNSMSFAKDRMVIQEEIQRPIVPEVPDELISGVIPLVLTAHTVWRNAYDNAYTWGRSVLEMKPRDPKAVSEVVGIYEEIMKL